MARFSQEGTGAPSRGDSGVECEKNKKANKEKRYEDT
jgi:hypothetical protein